MNPHPYRHYRRTYSVAEVRAGLGVLFLLGLVATWVVWMGAHPDPALFESLVPKAGAASSSSAPSQLPTGLAPPGWKTAPPAVFDASNLYEKIDGRAEFFLSRGFRSLA
ncbi:MAG TPA: DUF6599 family protein, partial [Thermoanaerobaculia bacterium]|nr:DUF6599 family protein [Thermoanaerobaculia bacterium]